MDSWINMSIPSAHLALVSMLDTNVVHPQRCAFRWHVLELWKTVPFQPDTTPEVWLVTVTVETSILSVVHNCRSLFQ